MRDKQKNSKKNADVETVENDGSQPEENKFPGVSPTHKPINPSSRRCKHCKMLEDFYISVMSATKKYHNESLRRTVMQCSEDRQHEWVDMK